MSIITRTHQRPFPFEGSNPGSRYSRKCNIGTLLFRRCSACNLVYPICNRNTFDTQTLNISNNLYGLNRYNIYNVVYPTRSMTCKSFSRVRNTLCMFFWYAIGNHIYTQDRNNKSRGLYLFPNTLYSGNYPTRCSTRTRRCLCLNI